MSIGSSLQQVHKKFGLNKNLPKKVMRNGLSKNVRFDPVQVLNIFES